MMILLYSPNDEYCHFLKYTFPAATVVVAYNYVDFIISLFGTESEERRYDLICYECNPRNCIESFNRLHDLLELKQDFRLVAFSDGALLESQTLVLWKMGISGIVSVQSDKEEAILSVLMLAKGNRVLGNTADIAKNDSVERVLQEQKQRIRLLNKVSRQMMQRKLKVAYQ